MRHSSSVSQIAGCRLTDKPCGTGSSLECSPRKPFGRGEQWQGSVKSANLEWIRRGSPNQPVSVPSAVLRLSLSMCWTPHTSPIHRFKNGSLIS